MPREIEIEENGQKSKLTVYTQQELDAATAAAKAGLVSEDDAKKLADSAAAKARREAETKLTELQGELAKAGKSAEQIQALQAQITEQAGKITGAERTLKGLKVLAGAGLAPATAEQLLALPALAGADFDKEEGQKAAIDGLKTLFPQLFPQQTQTQQQTFVPLGGVGASPTPAIPLSDLQAQIQEAEGKGEWQRAMSLKNQFTAQQRLKGTGA